MADKVSHVFPRFTAHGEGHKIIKQAEYDACTVGDIQSRLEAFIDSCHKEEIDVWHVTVDLMVLVPVGQARVALEG